MLLYPVATHAIRFYYLTMALHVKRDEAKLGWSQSWYNKLTLRRLAGHTFFYAITNGVGIPITRSLRKKYGCDYYHIYLSG